MEREKKRRVTRDPPVPHGSVRLGIGSLGSPLPLRTSHATLTSLLSSRATFLSRREPRSGWNVSREEERRGA